MNRRSFFKLGFGAAVAPVAENIIPSCMLAEPVRKMNTYHFQMGDMYSSIPWVSYNVRLVMGPPPDSTRSIRHKL